MTWTNRLRLFGGMFVVLVLVAVLTLVFNQRQAQALSVNGQVVADQYSVGAVYGGVVLHQDAHQGDTVKKGDKLFTVVSTTLQQDVSNGLDPASTEAFDVDKKTSEVTYKALADGLLADVAVKEGGFVQNGADLATITAVNTQYAVADFVLSPRDYERIQKGGSVSLLLPDNESVLGTVSAVSVKAEAGKALTKVTVQSKDLRAPGLAELTHPGTPVSATLHLRDDGPLAGPTDALTAFLLQIGIK